MPAVARPKTNIHEPRFESGEFDINVQSLKEQVCQIQTQNVQQTVTSTVKTHNYQFPLVLWQKLRFLHKYGTVIPQYRCPIFK